MENNDNRTQNAPSTDNTSALFVSSRKKQLEEQEAQRIAEEKEAQRLAAEEEVRRLEKEVELRRLKAEEDAKRLEEEAIERQKLAAMPPKVQPVQAPVAKPPSSSPTAGLTNLIEEIMEDPKKRLIAFASMGGTVLLILIISVIIIFSSGSVPKENIIGNWYYSGGTTIFSFYEESVYVQALDFDDEYYSYTVDYEIRGDKIALVDGETEVVLDYVEKEDIFEGELYFEDLDDPFLRDEIVDIGATIDPILLSNFLIGDWVYEDTYMMSFMPESTTSNYGYVSFYDFEGNIFAEYTYEVDAEGDIAIYGEETFYLEIYLFDVLRDMSTDTSIYRTQG